jgi:hypothetical protein
LFFAFAYLYLFFADPVLKRFVAAAYLLAVQGFKVLYTDPPYISVNKQLAVAVDLGSLRSNLALLAKAGQKRL